MLIAEYLNKENIKLGQYDHLIFYNEHEFMRNLQITLELRRTTLSSNKILLEYTIERFPLELGAPASSKINELNIEIKTIDLILIQYFNRFTFPHRILKIK